LSAHSNFITEGVVGSTDTNRIQLMRKRMICDAPGCRYECIPAGDRAETERAPVSLFFFLQKMARSCQRLARYIVIHGFARFSRLYEKRCLSGWGPNLYFT